MYMLIERMFSCGVNHGLDAVKTKTRNLVTYYNATFASLFPSKDQAAEAAFRAIKKRYDENKRAEALARKTNAETVLSSDDSSDKSDKKAVNVVNGMKRVRDDSAEDTGESAPAAKRLAEKTAQTATATEVCLCVYAHVHVRATALLRARVSCFRGIVVRRRPPPPPPPLYKPYR